jgi:hypothetical protein
VFEAGYAPISIRGFLGRWMPAVCKTFPSEGRAANAIMKQFTSNLATYARTPNEIYYILIKMVDIGRYAQEWSVRVMVWSARMHTSISDQSALRDALGTRMALLLQVGRFDI